MELILLIVIAGLMIVLLVLSLTKGQQSNSSRTITNSLAPANAGKPGRTEPQHPGTSHGNDANAEPEYATAPRCSAQEYDDYRRTATTEIRHDGPASRKHY